MKEDLAIRVNCNHMKKTFRYGSRFAIGKRTSFFFLTGCVFLLFAFIIFPGCRSAKKLQTAISKKDTTVQQAPTAPPEDLKADSIRFINATYARIKAQYINFNTFSAKVKVNYEGSDGKDYEVTAFIRMQKDKMIWVSINYSALGIEAFRALITPDSVKVINKMDKKIQVRSVSYLKEITKLPFDFSTLQDLIIGNPVYLDSNILYYVKNDNGISLLSVGESFKNYITLNMNDYTIKHSKLDDIDVLRARTCDITFDDYAKKDSIQFSAYRMISVAEKSKLDIELSFKSFNFNEPLSFPFNIPKNYKRK